MSSAKCPFSHHGVTHGRGCSHSAVGSFGRLFDLSPLYVSDEALVALGRKNGLMHDRSRTKGDSDIPAGYTFFAQFVDHDITLDVSSQLNSTVVQDPASIENLRTMSLDLDCVYGFGPEASPFLYSEDKLLVGNPVNENDVARVIEFDDDGEPIAGRALIGDPRNDENVFVSQLQYAFHLFHNKLLDSESCNVFEEAQQLARYHYQHIVLHDFLRRVCDPTIYRFAIERISRGEFPLIYGTDGEKLSMPVEFSVAAYRFGHTIVRDKYKPNGKKEVELFEEMSNGFSAVPKELTVEWEFLFETGKFCKGRKIDELLASELLDLPDAVVNDPDPLNKSLAFRNLVRGRSLGLPSGQAVARALSDAGYPVDPAIDLQLEKIKGWSTLSKDVKEELREQLPLFFYLLRESNVVNKGMHLGPTASAILLEVFGGILVHCDTSFIHSNWSPSDSIVGDDHSLTLADILRFVGVYDAAKPRRTKTARKKKARS